LRDQLVQDWYVFADVYNRNKIFLLSKLWALLFRRK
jgi:hypothetical protein